MSCPEFGSSGSGVVREWAKRYDLKGLSVDASYLVYGPAPDYDFEISDLLKVHPVDQYQYSFVGPLSMQKGCDKAFHIFGSKKKFNKKDTTALPNNGYSYDTINLSYRGRLTINIHTLTIDHDDRFYSQVRIPWWPQTPAASCPGSPVSTG